MVRSPVKGGAEHILALPERNSDEAPAPPARSTVGALPYHRRPCARHGAGERSGSARLLVIAVGTDHRLAAVAGRCRSLLRRGGCDRAERQSRVSAGGWLSRPSKDHPAAA